MILLSVCPFVCAGLSAVGNIIHVAAILIPSEYLMLPGQGKLNTELSILAFCNKMATTRIALLPQCKQAFLSGLPATFHSMTGLLELCGQRCKGLQQLSSVLCSPAGQVRTVTELGCNLLERVDTTTQHMVLLLAMTTLGSSISR